jgi:3-deoxy-D-manno-octulosonic-acid transferase
LYWSRWRERFGFLPSIDISRPLLWMHAVSVGEVEASSPLIDRMLTQLPQYQILITTVTPTGAQMVQKRFDNKVVHLYLPYDLPFSVCRFLRQVQPSICVVMETELWPNLYYFCHQKSIPIILANARMSLPSLKGYRLFKGLIKKTLACITQVIAQSKIDADRIISMGCDPAKVSIAGNMKFDVDLPSSIHEQAQNIRESIFPNRQIWIAASTHDNEEMIVLDAYKRILQVHPDCLLILAPRHPQRFSKVANLCAKYKLEFTRKSDNKDCRESTQVFLLDTLGEMQLYFACSDLAFIGGSLVPAGGHNMLEPASVGVPIISGIHVANFQEICDLLQQANAIRLVQDGIGLSETVIELFGDLKLRQQMGENAKRLVAENRGSADQVMSILLSILK